MRNTSPQASTVDLTSNMATRQTIPRTEVHIKNFLEENLVSIIAPANVPSILPRKYTLRPDLGGCLIDAELFNKELPRIGIKSDINSDNKKNGKYQSTEHIRFSAT